MLLNICKIIFNKNLTQASIYFTENFFTMTLIAISIIIYIFETFGGERKRVQVLLTISIIADISSRSI